jgi:hypothetical protein
MVALAYGAGDCRLESAGVIFVLVIRLVAYSRLGQTIRS